MELHKKTAIQIISVENPNRFWFRTKENEQKLNADIEAYMMSRDSKNDSNFVPKLSEMIIVKSNDSFEIAQIKKINEESGTIFCLFTNGTFHKVKRHRITPLTNQLADEVINTISLGSIVGVAPIRMVSSKTEIIFKNQYVYKQFYNDLATTGI